MKYLLMATMLMILMMFLSVAAKHAVLGQENTQLRKQVEGLQRTRNGVVNNAYVCYSADTKRQIDSLLEEK